MRRVVTVFEGLAGLVLLLIPMVVMWFNRPITGDQSAPALAVNLAQRIPLAAGASVRSMNDTMVELQDPQQLNGAKASLGSLDHSRVLGQPAVNNPPSKASTCAQVASGNTGCTDWVVSETDARYIDPEADANAAGVYHFNDTQPNSLEMAGLPSVLMRDFRVSGGSALLVCMYLTYFTTLAILWLGIRAEYIAGTGEHISKAGHR